MVQVRLSQFSDLARHFTRERLEYIFELYVEHNNYEIGYSQHEQENEGRGWRERRQRVYNCVTVILQAIGVCFWQHGIVVDLPITVHPNAEASVNDGHEGAVSDERLIHLHWVVERIPALVRQLIAQGWLVNDDV